MQTSLLLLGGLAVTPAHLAFALAGLLLGLVAARLFGSGHRVAAEIDERLDEIARLQSEATGRMAAMAEVFGSRQSDLTRGLLDRFDGLSDRLGRSLGDNARATGASLSALAERLAVIDRAQRDLVELSGDVLELRSVLADKQARGAFGQGRMEAIVADALPAGAYLFQATLSTGVRPDCLVRLPGAAPSLAIDAKFPLEGWTAFREAPPEGRERAAAGFRRDVLRHVADVAAKYLIPGETQDVAFLFVPSESIFADLHEHFDDVIQRAHRARVVIVSPSLLLLAVQVVQSIGRDAAVRSQAHLIQAEVGRLVDDVARLAERVSKLQAHFGQTARDLDQLGISADKVIRRAHRIEALDLDAEAPAAPRLVGE